MRKLFNLFAAALVVLAAVSCEKSEVLPCDVEGKVVTLSATIDNGGTKTSLGAQGSDGVYPVYWSEGDKIAVIQGTNVYEFTLVGNSSTSTSGTFTSSNAEGFDPDSPYTAFYPASAVNKNTGAITISGMQTYAEKSFGPGAMPMAATVTSGTTMTFNNLFGVVKVVVKGASGEVLEFIEFGSTIPLCGDSELEEIGGKLSFSIKEGASDYNNPITYASNIKLNCVDENNPEGVSIDNAGGKEFLIAVPAGNQQFAVVLHTKIGLYYGSYYKSVSADKTINVGEILKMQIIDLTADGARDNMTIAYGSNGNGTLIGKTVWAPVNVGYEDSNPIGTLCKPNLVSSLNSSVNVECPSGWRLPEQNELKYLYNYNYFDGVNGKITNSTKDYGSYRKKNENGLYLYGVATPTEELNSVFLPINPSHEWGPSARYWTLTRNNSNYRWALILYLDKNDGYFSISESTFSPYESDTRKYGYVRCVKQ